MSEKSDAARALAKARWDKMKDPAKRSEAMKAVAAGRTPEQIAENAAKARAAKERKRKK